MGPLEQQRRRQLNAAVYQYLQQHAPEAASHFKLEMTPTGLLDESTVLRLESDALYRQWTSIVATQLKLHQYEERNKELQKKIEFYKNVGPKTKKITSGSMPRAPPVQTLVGHRRAVRRLQFHPFLPLLVSSGDDGLIMVWDYENGGSLEKTLKQHTGAVLDIHFDSKGKWLASASADTTVKVWDCVGFECVETLYGHDDLVSAVRFFQKSERLLSCSKDATIRLWDVVSGTCLRVYSEHRDWIRTLCIAEKSCFANATTFASAGNETTIFVWTFEDGASGPAPSQFSAHDHVIEYLCFATDVLLDVLQESRSFPPHLFIKDKSWSTASEVKEIPTNGVLKKEKEKPIFLSTVLFSASRDRTVKMWDTARGACLKTFEGHENWVKQITIHPSGRMILSCSDDRSIRVWDVLTGACRLSLNNAHRSFVNCLTFSPKSPVMATGGMESEILVWDCSTSDENKHLRDASASLVSAAV